MRRGLPILLLFGLTPLSAFTQTRLQWRFTSGETFTLERVYRQKQQIEVKGKTFKHETTATWISLVAIRGRDAAGWLVDVTLEEVTCKNDGALAPAAFDDRLAERMRGGIFQLRVTSKGEIRKMTGYEDFIKRASGEKKDVEKVVRALFSEEGMRQSFEEVFSILPHRPVAKGDTWKREAIDPAPPFGSFRSKIRFRDDGPRDGLHAIAFTIQTSYEKPDEQPHLFRIIKGVLKGEEGKGSYLFDAKAGRLVRGDKSMTVHGELTVEINGATTTLNFISENQFKLRLTPR